MELGLAVLQLVLICILLEINNAGIVAQITPVCHHPLFCNDQLLDLVKLSDIFSDSKDFVDRPLLETPDEVLQSLFSAYSEGGIVALDQTILNLTSSSGSDLLKWEPPDWTPRPSFIDEIEDSQLREWAVDLNSIWKQLGRQVSPSVAVNPERHSLLLQPHPFIVPGGRFREPYYWDSFWVVQGLLLGEMEETARHIIENMASAIMVYGFVPNGGRTYYTGRSQPPLLTQMVECYYNFTANLTFVETVLPALSREYDFWMTNRSINVGLSTANYYSSPTNTPRPESYLEDVTTATPFPPGEQMDFYSAIASAAESGWDFSTRWFEAGSVNLSSIRTQRILPVDLNAIMCQNELTLHRLYGAVGDSNRAQDFLRSLEERRQSFDSLFWNEERGLWMDRDLDSRGPLDSFYASSLVPLLWECNSHNSTKVEATLETLESLGVLDYPGGIPASLVAGSGEQWDFPNAWAPHQWFPVAAWAHSGVATLRKAARRMAKTWITSTYSAWRNYNNTMFEKYSCTELGTPGEGGEYGVQSGFGWTNSVVLYFLWLYPDLRASDNTSSPADPPPGNLTDPPPGNLTDSNITDSNITDSTPSNGTSSLPSSGRSLGWVAVPVLLLVLVAVVVACGIWCRWLYRTGERRYWGRVHNEHLRAASAGTDTSGQRQERNTSEETEESVENDRKGLFS